MLNGRRYAQSTGTDKPRLAAKFESDLKGMILAGMVGAPSATGRKAPTFADFSIKFLASIDKRAAAKDLDRDTQRTYHNGCRLLSATRVWKMRLDQLLKPDAAELKFPGSPSNANQALRTLSVMLTYACELGILRARPQIPLRKENKRIVIVEPWLQDLLLDLAPSALRTFMIVMLDAGPRPEEVCRLRWEHVYFDRSSLYIPYGKTDNSERYLPITDRMRTALKAHKLQMASDHPRVADSPWVFPSWKQAQAHIANPKDAWQDLIVAAESEAKKRNLPKLPDGLVLYSCRHTFATNFLDASGGNVGKLMLLMGHADIQTTQKYLHPSTADAAELMNEHRRKLEIVARRRA